MNNKTSPRSYKIFFWAFILVGFFTSAHLTNNIKETGERQLYMILLSISFLGTIVMAYFAMANIAHNSIDGSALDINQVAEGTLLNVIRVIGHEGNRYVFVQQETLDQLRMTFDKVGEPHTIKLGTLSGSTLVPDSRYVAMIDNDGKIALHSHPLRSQPKKAVRNNTVNNAQAVTA